MTDLHLEKFPRYPLAQLPTPIQSLPALTRALGGPELLIKRGETVLFRHTGGTRAIRVCTGIDGDMRSGE